MMRRAIERMHNNAPGSLYWHLYCHMRRRSVTPSGQNCPSFAIRDPCALTITHHAPRISNGSSILTRPSAGRSCGISPRDRCTRLQASGLASQLKGGAPSFSPSNLVRATGGGQTDDRGLLITLYALVVLMDLGLDPASKRARKMIDRVDNRLVFKPLNNRPFLHSETEPLSTAEF
jgi:hypothetical protein